jgi:octaprenyl-diphosphate synthase
MKFLAELKSVSAEHGIEGNLSMALTDVLSLLESDFSLLEEKLFNSCTDAQSPISDICAHILNAGGKRIRPALSMLSARAININGPVSVDLALVCELLHNATLLHDDVIDEGDVRRGKPAARMVWSNALSILGGDYMLMQCVEKVSAMDLKIMPLFVKTLKQLVQGEVVQLGFRESLKITEEEYFSIVKGKTASLFKFSAEAGALLCEGGKEQSSKLGEFAWNVGVAFQLVDDALDFKADAADLGKNLLADIAQGKMTLPVILAARNNKDVLHMLKELMSTDEKSGKSERLIDDISSYIKETAVIDSVLKIASDYTEKALSFLNGPFSGDDRAILILKNLALALSKRKK